ncbi:MAG TPA: hypothetical protein VGN78_15300 [Solirubrobacteraceae bacterium]|nr:hypothetical protein [Solirubrobacteraceae bacterium]
MIVRIATEGQYRLEDEQAAKLNELDNEIVALVQAGDEEGFRRLFSEMLALARSGAELGDDELEESDVILPPPDISLAEAAAEFTGEGLIPG